MKDLTEGSVTRIILEMAGPLAAGMIFQTLYLLVDLYFVAGLGDASIAGVGAAGTLLFVVMALTQVLGVGAVALISQAVGRKDAEDANLVFNQSIVVAVLCAITTVVGGYLFAGTYMSMIAADAATQAQGVTFLYWFLPGLALQFALVTMGSALRGTGIVKPTMVVQVLTVILNTILAPILIAGWVTGVPLGVLGAGLATTISVAAGVAMLTAYFVKLEQYVGFRVEQMRPQVAVWTRMFDVGLPAGGEFAMLFIYMAIVYWLISSFGAAAQAGFGIGSRVMQSIFLPAMAIAFAAGPVAGQNFGARRPDRVRETFRKAVLLNGVVMIGVTLFLQWRPDLLVGFFTPEPEAEQVGAEFLRLISWNFLAQGVIFTSSGIFQGLGNTRPALLSSALRLLMFVPVAVWLSTRDGFTMAQVWHVSVATVLLQALISWRLIEREFRRKLGPMEHAAATMDGAATAQPEAGLGSGTGATAAPSAPAVGADRP